MRTVGAFIAVSSMYCIVASTASYADIDVTIRGTIVSSCSITTPDLDFDFGDVDFDEVGVNWKALNIDIDCSGPAQVRLGTVGEAPQRLIPLMNVGGTDTFARVCLSSSCGLPFGTAFDVPAGVTSVSLNVRPEGKFAPGAFSGTTVIEFDVL